MNVDFFVFGVPDGFDLWEDDQKEKAHFGTFYDNSSDEVKFLVQMHPHNGRNFCYYNYLVYADVVDQDWRPNSFLGLSLRFDSYCKDARKIYRVLDHVFNAHIIGSILQEEKGKMRYTMSHFSSKKETLNKIRDRIFEMLQTDFSQDDFMGIEAFPKATNPDRIPVCYLSDCTPEIVFENVRQYGRIAISPSPHTSSEVQATMQKYELRFQDTERKHQQQMQRVREEYERKQTEMQNAYAEEIAKKEQEKEGAMASINGVKAELSSKEAETKNLRITIENLNKKVEMTQKEVERLKLENEKLKQGKKRTADNNSKSVNSGEFKSESVVITVVKWFLRIFSLIILLILLFRPNKPVTPDYSNLESKMDDVYTAVKGLQSSLNFAQKEFYRESEIDLGAVNIDIKEYKGGGKPLDKGKKYTVVAKNSNEKNAVWEVKGARQEETADPNVINITPVEEDVAIIYRVGNSTKERKLKAH